MENENGVVLTQEQRREITEKKLWYDQNGNLLKNFENFELILKYLQIDIYYNEISKEEIIFTKGRYKILEETDITILQNEMENLGYIITDKKFYKFIMLKCKSNRINLVKNYLEECCKGYDGKDYIKELSNCLIVQEEHKEIKDKLLLKWLLSCVHISMNTLDNQFNIEGVLTLQGGQGLGKTRFLRSLIPDLAWFKDGLCIDPKNRDDLMKSLRYWVCELGELDATLKSEQAVLKQFFTSTQDDFRIPYDRKALRLARTTCFCASINKKDFLKDPTGNRRWWVIECLGIEQHNIDLKQLWGQVTHLYKEGKINHYLDTEEIKELETHNRQYMEGDTIDAFLPAMFFDTNNYEEYDSAILLEEYYKLGYGKPSAKAFGKALGRRGYTSRRSNGRTIWKTNILKKKIDLSKPILDIDIVRKKKKINYDSWGDTNSW